MRNLVRNTSLVYYRLYLGKTELLDEWGNKTGSFEPSYGEVQKAWLSVSPNKGSAETDMFGTLDDYDRTMTTTDIRCPINTDTVLWLDGADTTKAHNYIVKKRAPWKNSISFAVKKVDVSNG